MYIDFANLDIRKGYFWIASTVTPRPVAWVSTTSAAGVTNVAPYSFFQCVASDPPTLMVAPLSYADGSVKDTVRNAQETGEMTISLVSFAQKELMNESSMAFAHEVSEFERCGVPAAESVKVKPPRVAGAPVAFECKVAQVIPYPAERPTTHLVLGVVVAAHVDEGILAADGTIDPDKLDIVSRMGADWYGRTRSADNFKLARPKGWDKRQEK
jgi:flavin reductase (DIM6/NTAB) family NADH-FMN oxidoreductase RutF